jgi:prophage regulatory protein
LTKDTNAYTVQLNIIGCFILKNPTRKREAKMQQRLVSVKQAGQMIDTHPTTIWRWVKMGLFPKPLKIGPSCTRWRLEDLEAWIEKKAMQQRR